MCKRYVLFFIMLTGFCNVWGQKITDFRNADWRIFHKVKISEYVDTDSDEWKNIPRMEKITFIQIPVNELKSLTTKELIESYLDCPYTRSFFLFSEIEDYYYHLFRGFNGFSELLSRENVVEEVIQFYSQMELQDDRLSPAGVPVRFHIQFLEYLIGNPVLLEKFNTKQLQAVAVELVQKQKDMSNEQSFKFDGVIDSNIYAISQLLACEKVGRKNEINSINGVDFLQQSGRIANDNLDSQIIAVANEFIGK